MHPMDFMRRVAACQKSDEVERRALRDAYSSHPTWLHLDALFLIGQT